MNAQNISEILDALAARFGATGAALWAAIVKAQLVGAIKWAFIFTVLYTLLFVAWRVIMAPYNKDLAEASSASSANDDSSEYGRAYRRSEAQEAVVIGRFIFFAVLALLTVIMVSTAPVQEVLNPQYAALKDIIGALNPAPSK